MTARKVSSFAEYAVRRWMREKGMRDEDFSVLMTGRTALVTDANGDTVTLEYDGTQREVHEP